MNASATTASPADSGADTIVVGLFDGEPVAHDLEGAPLTALVDSGEARPKLRHLALAHAAGKRWIVAGLGARAAFDHERARLVAATVLGRATELGAERLCWKLPHGVDDDVAGALVEGTLLAAYRFDRYRSQPAPEPHGPRSLIVSAHHDVAAPVARAAVLAEHANRARDLQNRAANDLTPTVLAAHARTLEGVDVTVEGREEIVARGMGAFAAVAQGSPEEPALITLRYEAPGATAPLIGLVGKAVTFDTGGISIKGRTKMSDMKYDMSGGSAVIEAIAAIARLGLPVRVVGVVGATENMPSGSAFKPGDVLTAMTGTTIEIVDTDAEGRLVLADCLAHAIALGAKRLVDVATLTGAVAATFSKTYAGLMSTDDAWAAAVEAAGTRTGELLWRLPLHPDYDELAKGRYADLANTTEPRRAGAIVAASFLKAFTGDVPWAHLDIAGTGWDLGRAYSPKGGSGFGVRLLVDLVEAAGRA